MWLFLLFMCFPCVHVMPHGGEGTSTPSNNADEIIDRFLQNYPQYANMDFSGGHVQALLNTIQNYPISKIFYKI
uniref:Uncharacterized protein n=1 Tax=Meloidogyne enterolobii TaxID=390850 RepID=A0A6V7UHR8_MELEN|nr:unnamed protein product [Meloidogyne enterolobii]